VVAKELLEDQPPVLYTVSAELHACDLPCLFPGCKGWLQDGWMMRRHFWDVHPMGLVKVPKEGKYDCCEKCGMQVHPLYPCHRLSKECQVRVERQQQWEVAVTSALALRQQFTVSGDVCVCVYVLGFRFQG
jgi:hypothetical protein